jgi:hypothetical protein
MIKQKSPCSIVNMSSISGIKGFRLNSPYSAR